MCVCVHACVDVLIHAHTYGEHKKISDTLLYHFLPSFLDTVSHWTWNSSFCKPGWLLPILIPYCWGYRNMGPMPGLMWFLGVQTQAFVLTQQALLPNEAIPLIMVECFLFLFGYVQPEQLPSMPLVPLKCKAHKAPLHTGFPSIQHKLCVENASSMGVQGWCQWAGMGAGETVVSCALSSWQWWRDLSSTPQLA